MTLMHDHDKGLAFDLPKLLSRRQALGVFAGGLTSAALAACGGGGTTATKTTTADGIPEETAGPYPGDGSNGPNVLAESGVVRSDITRSFGDASGTATGVPTTVELTLLDIAKGGTPLAGAAVYLWHCDAAGRYSLYDQEISGENYLRGVQESDANGKLTFKTIFPAAYSGRWPHIHFEVYPSLAEATKAGNPSATSQLALPAEVCNAVYATDGYSASARNMAQTSLASDNVFSDGAALETPTVTGSVAAGYTAELTIGV